MVVKKAEATSSTSISLAFIIAARSSFVASRMASTVFDSTVVAPLTPLVTMTGLPGAPGRPSAGQRFRPESRRDRHGRRSSHLTRLQRPYAVAPRRPVTTSAYSFTLAAASDGSASVDDVDDRAADDCSVGDTSHRLKMLRLRYTKSYRDWQVRVRFAHVRRTVKVRRQLVPRAGDARDAHAVDEAGAELRDARDPFRRAGRREQVDQAQVVLHAGCVERVRLLGRQVDDDEAVGAGLAASRQNSSMP